jgi:hypothetical protein
LAKQRERCLRPGKLDLYQQIDHDLFAYCLAQLVRAAELCQRFDGSVQAALRSFHAAVPAAGHIRDVITHFDAYEQGIGIAQRVKGPDDPGGYYQFTGANLTRVLGEHSLDVAHAWDAAEKLFVTVSERVMAAGALAER